MQNQINTLRPGLTYRFQIGDNNTIHVGQFVSVVGDNLIFYVTENNEGHYKTYPINIISAWQPRQGLPGLDDAFVMIPNGGNRKSRKCRKCRKCRKSRKYNKKRH